MDLDHKCVRACVRACMHAACSSVGVCVGVGVQPSSFQLSTGTGEVTHNNKWPHPALRNEDLAKGKRNIDYQGVAALSPPRQASPYSCLSG